MKMMNEEYKSRSERKGNTKCQAGSSLDCTQGADTSKKQDERMKRGK